MRIFQPYPNHSCPLPVLESDKVISPVPVYYIRYRYPHHSLSSGFDRLCDYVEGETVQLSRSLYLAGESLLRLPAKIVSRYGGHYEYSRYDYILELQVRKHFRTHQNSIYHYIYGEKSYNLLSRLNEKNGNKILLTVHHPSQHMEWLFRSTDHLRSVDHVTVVSRTQIAFWEQVVGKGNVTWIPYAVDTSYFTPKNEAEVVTPLRCFFVGYHERDFENLPCLVEKILKGHPQAEFCMVSTDDRCAPIADSHERAIWHKRVNDEQYLKLLQESQLLVLPLTSSTTCTAVLEAMACGVPVITNEGGIEDYLEEDSSTIFPPGDVSSMADAVVGLLSNDDLRRSMSESARRTALKYSWPSTARSMVDLYDRIMNS